jgi:tetratricopeptide (TPR) repeat protein
MRIAHQSISRSQWRKWQSDVFSFLTPLLLLFAVAGCSAEAKKARLLDGAKGYFDAGEYEKAKIEYMNVLRKDPENAIACQQLGIIWFEQGAPLRAFPFLRKAVELAPDNLPARTKLALSFMQLRSPQEARQEAIKILERDPDNAEAMILLADTTFSKEDSNFTEDLLWKLKDPDRAPLHMAAATLAARRGDLAALEREAQRALALDPKSVRAQLMVANIFLAKKDLVKAGEAFKAAADLAPLRSLAQLRFAEFKLNTGAVPEGKALLQELTQKVPDYLPAWQLQAQIAFGEKKYDDSLALIEKVLKRDPGNIEAGLLQAQTLAEKGEVKKAISLLESLRKAFPNLPGIGYQLARAHLQDANPAQARGILDQVVSAYPDYAEAILLLARVNLGSGDAKGAVDLMEALLKKRSTLVDAQMLLAEGYRSLGRFDDAAAVYREQIKTSPQNPTAHFFLGMILLQKGDLPGARTALAMAQDLKPDDLTITYQLVDLDIRQNDFDAAHQKVGVHLQKQPPVAGAYLIEGRIFAAQRDWDGAETAFLKSLELNPESSEAYNELIGTYVAAGRLPDASAKLEAHLAKNPDDQRALMTSALIHEKLNDFEKARLDYENILSKSPDTMLALNNLAYIYGQRMGQIDKAFEMARKARSLSPGHPSIADTLGWILYKKGNYQEALALITEGAAKLSDMPEVQYHLGMAAYMMGQTDVATTALKLAAAEGPNFPGKAEAKAKLAVLEGGGSPNATLSATDLEAALQKQPGDLILQMRLAESYERDGANEKAVAAYEKVLKLNSRLTAATVKLAQLQAGPLKDPAKALELAGKARELAPNDPRVAGLLGALTYQAGDYPKALGLLQESARDLPNDAAVLRDLAWAAYSQGRVEDARKSMEQVLKASPTAPQKEDATLFLELTALDQGSKDLADSVSKVEALLQKDPGHVPALMARAAQHLEKGEAKLAIELYGKVLGKFPDFAPAQKGLATLYVADPANLQRGYDLAVKARKTLSDDPDLALTLGALAFQRKEYAFAVQLFQESARKRPLDAKGLYYLGRSLLATNETAEGRETLAKAQAAGLPEPLAADAKKALEDLDKPKK